MVKNIQGGSKGKSQARKLSSSYVAVRSKLILSTNELEKYACVTKYFGQGRCIVRTVDDLELQCIIRNKFKGRSRRSCLITVGTILLVGLREWEGDNHKICDVLEIYDTDDYNQLKSIPNTRVSNLDRYLSSYTSAALGENDFEFSDESYVERVADQIIPKEENMSICEIDEIDVDDI